MAEAVSSVEAPKTRSPRSSQAPKDSLEASSGKVHRKSPVRSSRRSNGTDSGSPKTMAAAAGTGGTNGAIVDSVGVMVASPGTETSSVVTPLVESKTAVSREEIAHLAYSYWAARGFTHGLADEDWIRAEAELLSRG